MPAVAQWMDSGDSFIAPDPEFRWVCKQCKRLEGTKTYEDAIQEAGQHNLMWHTALDLGEVAVISTSRELVT